MSSAPSWTDSHCHLDGADDPLAALGRARSAGVGRVICVGTSLESSRKAVGLVRRLAGAVPLAGLPPSDPPPAGLPPAGLPLAWATVGLHPHEASRGVGPVEDLLGKVAVAAPPRAAGAVVAVGECGLDYYYEHSPRELQREAFAAQVAAANHYQLALVVHTRDAWDDTFDVLVGEGVPEATVLHCFTGGVDEARRCLEIGAYLSFSGIVTFKSAEQVREAARFCPADRLLVETDSPYLAPVPYRGTPNEPANVAVVGGFLGALRGDDPAVLAEVTSANARAVFGLEA